VSCYKKREINDAHTSDVVRIKKNKNALIAKIIKDY